MLIWLRGVRRVRGLVGAPVYSGRHGRTIVFAETKKEANELGLNQILRQESQVLHGDIPQKQREVTLASFREGTPQHTIARPSRPPSPPPGPS